MMKLWSATLAVAIALVSVSVAQASAAPTLGVKSVTPYGTGFGRVKPSKVDFGGDPTSSVTGVKWRSWGGARAIGHGAAFWVWPGWCVACGAVKLPATVVAFGRTTCQGQSAYAYVEWFFPSRGQSFNRRLAIENLCTGTQPPESGKLVKCGQTPVRSGNDVALAHDINMFDSPISCQTARQFVANSAASDYLGQNARYSVDGWWCGSELSMDLGGVQSFSCVRGDFTNVNFALGRA